jgi:hypothetical protein
MSDLSQWAKADIALASQFYEHMPLIVARHASITRGHGA